MEMLQLSVDGDEPEDDGDRQYQLQTIRWRR